jgi:quinol monooxygenase YgiN
MVRVWEYDVSETSRAEFERTYGAAGDWVQLYSSSDGFRGTELFVSLSDPGRYLTVDRFTDEGAWRAFLTEHRDAYARLDAASKGLDHRRVPARRWRGRLSQYCMPAGA